ncbi:MAG: PepSY-associated TM helix domain-containing protein [Armatimonadetes bacterium]|nr:PepSY-associated TM helix domain-containing protein [Armatimonadota bacterium]
MFSLMTVLFFALTGITLNHPEWTFGGKPIRTVVRGKLDPGFAQGEKVDWLKVVEQLRRDQPVKGSAVDMRVDGDEGSLSFKSPGSVSECFFKLENGDYEMSISAQGWLGVMNDLHRGRDSGSNWGWLIDVSGVFLSLLSVTGLGILFYLKKSRVAGLIVGSVGLAIILLLGYLASR